MLTPLFDTWCSCWGLTLVLQVIDEDTPSVFRGWLRRQSSPRPMVERQGTAFAFDWNWSCLWVLFKSTLCSPKCWDICSAVWCSCKKRWHLQGFEKHQDTEHIVNIINFSTLHAPMQQPQKYTNTGTHNVSIHFFCQTCGFGAFFDQFWCSRCLSNISLFWYLFFPKCVSFFQSKWLLVVLDRMRIYVYIDPPAKRQRIGC